MVSDTPTPETTGAVSDFAIAQAFREWDAMPNDDGSREVRASLQRTADWINTRAREIDAAQVGAGDHIARLVTLGDSLPKDEKWADYLAALTAAIEALAKREVGDGAVAWVDPYELMMIREHGGMIVATHAAEPESKRTQALYLHHNQPAPTPAVEDRALETSRRQAAVELAIADGWSWDGDQWTRPPSPAVEVTDTMVTDFEAAYIAEFERLEPITRPDYSGRMQVNMRAATKVALTAALTASRRGEKGNG